MSGATSSTVSRAVLRIADAFSAYGATLRDVDSSVSAWVPDGSLVVSLWGHHYRKGPGKTFEYADSIERWSGPGNQELKENLAKAFAERSPVRLVVARTLETARVEAGEDPNRIPADYESRTEQVGTVIEFDGNDYVIRFRQASPGQS